MTDLDQKTLDVVAPTERMRRKCLNVILAARKGGYTAQATANYLNQEGYTTVRGFRFTAANVHRILTREGVDGGQNTDD